MKVYKFHYPSPGNPLNPPNGGLEILRLYQIPISSYPPKWGVGGLLGMGGNGF